VLDRHPLRRVRDIPRPAGRPLDSAESEAAGGPTVASAAADAARRGGRHPAAASASYLYLSSWDRTARRGAAPPALVGSQQAAPRPAGPLRLVARCRRLPARDAITPLRLRRARCHRHDGRRRVAHTGRRSEQNCDLTCRPDPRASPPPPPAADQ